MPETQEELLEAGADAGGRTIEMSLFNMQKQTHRLFGRRGSKARMFQQIPNRSKVHKTDKIAEETRKRWEDCITGENRSGWGKQSPWGGRGATKTSENLQKLGKLRQHRKWNTKKNP